MNPRQWIKWHHRLHQITGEMARVQERITKDQLQRWEEELRAIAKEFATERNTK